ncbi:MAG: hypothetical protein ACE5OO_07940 [Candidatus Bathyarchaeia archaeon]
MSDEGGMTLTGFATMIFGAVILLLGLLLTYFSLRTDVGTVDPRLFAPIGAAVALIGGFMLLAREA